MENIRAQAVSAVKVKWQRYTAPETREDMLKVRVDETREVAEIVC